MRFVRVRLARVKLEQFARRVRWALWEWTGAGA
jgi:hypothetical protein